MYIRMNPLIIRMVLAGFVKFLTSLGFYFNSQSVQESLRIHLEFASNS